MGLPSIAKHVGCEGDIAKPHQPARTLRGEVTEPKPLVEDARTRPASSAGLHCEIAVEPGRAVKILDVTGLHGEPVSLGG
jgi:hypothetical protein